MSDDKQALLIERQQQVLVARINQSPMNPIGVAQVAALNALLDDTADDSSVRAIVIRGAAPADSDRPTHFSVGPQPLSRLTACPVPPAPERASRPGSPKAIPPFGVTTWQ